MHAKKQNQELWPAIMAELNWIKTTENEVLKRNYQNPLPLLTVLSIHYFKT